METSDLHFNWNNSYSGEYGSDAGRNWQGAPKITQAQSGDYDDVHWGDDWKWRMRIKGRRPITIELFKDGFRIKRQQYSTDMTMFQCTVKNVTHDGGGNYKLVISNRRGTVVTYCTLRVR